jgi:hypothetical protein
MNITDFYTKMEEFIKNSSKVNKHKEYIKILYDHNSIEGCDKSIKEISIKITEE